MARIVRKLHEPPKSTDIELTVIGPGYGESILVHVGEGRWIIVDSCIDRETGRPRALTYLEGIEVDPSTSVALVVATHWHDDHIAGMEQLATVCRKAAFCCPAALLDEECRTIIAALKGQPVTPASSNVSAIFATLTALLARNSHPCFAIADRRVFLHGKCEVWTLSPSDGAFLGSIRSLKGASPADTRRGVRLPALSPNRASAVLWIEVEGVALLLGADLPKAGWKDILESRTRPLGRASVVKVPHHGSQDAFEPRVWNEMTTTQPVAVVTPSAKGMSPPPTAEDLTRILLKTKDAYITAEPRSQQTPTKLHHEVDRVLRQKVIKRDSVGKPGIVRLRRSIGSEQDWTVERFGGACSVGRYVTVTADGDANGADTS